MSCISIELFPLKFNAFQCKLKHILNVMASRSRSYVFTWNNYTAEAEESLARLDCRYLCYGRERGESGTPHLQGMVCFSHAKSHASVRKLLAGCHIERQRGTYVQARTYCQKDGDFVERGTCPLDPEDQALEQSRRYSVAWDLAKSGDVENIDPVIRLTHYRTILAIGKDFRLRPESLDSVCGLWIHGRPGVGKSHSVVTAFPGAYVKDCSKWWDGYQGEPVVWLDDVDPSSSSWLCRFLKIWADRYPFPAQTKGGSLFIRPGKFIVTSNYTIGGMGFEQSSLDAILRRFREVELVSREQKIEFE